MTTLDEALRALEKKWRDAVEADRKQPMRMLENVYLCKGMESCADELAALLSSRQEVAPVAQVLEIRKAEDEDAWFGRFESTELLKVGDLLYTSTGQTSDARDALRWKWMWENGAELCRYTDGDGIAGFAIFIGGKRRSLGKTQAETIDAAMQEAGK